MRILRMLASTAVAAGVMSTSSFAADEVSVDSPAEPVVESGLHDWTGLYIGLSGGYLDPNMNIGFGATSIDYGDSGYLLGGTIGYNKQMGSFVFGVEADLSYAKIDGGFNNLFGFGFDGSAEGQYFGTVRGRVGLAMDRLLVFGTAGAAFTDLDIVTPAGPIEDHPVGYTVGGGVEYAFTDQISTKVEYLYSNFGDTVTTLFPGNVSTDLDMNIVRVGVNFKF